MSEGVGVASDEDVRDGTVLWDQRQETTREVNIARLAVLIHDARAAAHRRGWDEAIEKAACVAEEADSQCDYDLKTLDGIRDDIRALLYPGSDSK